MSQPKGPNDVALLKVIWQLTCLQRNEQCSMLLTAKPIWAKHNTQHQQAEERFQTTVGPHRESRYKEVHAYSVGHDRLINFKRRTMRRLLIVSHSKNIEDWASYKRFQLFIDTILNPLSLQDVSLLVQRFPPSRYSQLVTIRPQPLNHTTSSLRRHHFELRIPRWADLQSP